MLGQYCTIRGYRAAPLSVVAPVDNAWLVFAAILGFVAFGEVPGPMTVLGAALIIAGGVALTRVKAR
ncbi:MAG: EamA family transporter [Exiguobacterium profundum]|nr:MAG: EamA family transporter [Exiguobacterium profundum]